MYKKGSWSIILKSSFKFITLIILVFIINACSSNSNSFLGFKPHFSTEIYVDAYAIMENGKINRMGCSDIIEL